MTRRVFVPRDAAALGVGADAVARELAGFAQASATPIEIVRTGSRGMLWLEPLLEVEIDGVRHGFGPLEPGDVAGLVRLGLLTATAAGWRSTPGQPGLSSRSTSSRGSRG